MNAAMAVGIMMGVLIATGCFAMACLVWMGRKRKDDTPDPDRDVKDLMAGKTPEGFNMFRETDERLSARLNRIVGTDDPDLIRKMLDEAHDSRRYQAIAPGPEPTAKELSARLPDAKKKPRPQDY